MKHLLYIQAVIEIIGGILFYFAPDLILRGDLSLTTLLATKLYSISAVIIGLIGLEVARSFEYTGFSKRIYLLLMCFHLLVSFVCHGFYQAEAMHIGGVITHALLCIAMMAFYFIDLPKFEQN